MQPGAVSGVVSLEALSGARDYLKTVAIVVEAAGTVDRAIELGLIGGEDTAVIASGIRDVIPPCRGGTSTDPAAEEKWAMLLAAAILDRGFEALDQMRAMAQMMESRQREAALLSQMLRRHPRLDAVKV